MTSIDKMDLAQLFNTYQSDKDTNGYSPLYHILFDRMKHETLNVAEIGIGTMIPNVRSSMAGYAPDTYIPGASIRAWRDYFVNSQIYGFDIQPDTQFTEERIQTRLCNSTNAESVNQAMGTLNNVQFDIIVDDGEHDYRSQYQTLANFYPYLKEGGIYIIEDIYPGSPVSADPNALRSIVKNDPFFFSGLKNNLCIIYKRPLQSKYLNF